MNKQQEIEEMAYSICPMPQASEYITDCTKCGGNGDCMRQKFAAKFLGKGYCKQSEVVKEFVAGVTVELNKRRDSELYGKDSILGIINKVAAEYGVEVEK